jgi:H+/Cl- antiporter ClcA
MTSTETFYEKLKKWLDSFITGSGYTSITTGYITGELQFLLFIIVLSVFFRLFSIPLAIILLIFTTVFALYFSPVIKDVEKENMNDLNRVLYWMVVYFAIIIAITLWGG